MLDRGSGLGEGIGRARLGQSGSGRDARVDLERVRVQYPIMELLSPAPAAKLARTVTERSQLVAHSG